MSTNHKPIIRGTDDGIWRRLVLIPFEVQIPEEKVDKDLKYKLLREAPAILNWMTEGAYMWMQEGLEMPEKLKDASQSYRTEMDVVEQFIEEKCNRMKGARETGKKLYDEYKMWADENNEYKMDKNKFGKKMKEKFESKKMNNGVNYIGIELKEMYPGMKALQ